MNYKEITELKDGPVQYELLSRGNIKMVQHPYPYSILQEEFDFLRNIIVENNLKFGYECATAFGISSLAIGLGFKETQGKCVTIDAYIEEKCNHPEKYKNFEKEVYDQADGYKSVKYLIEKFDLKNHLFPEIGWSPDDTEKCVRKHIKEPLDFVFIDAGHFPEQIIKDIDAFIPLLGDRYAIVFHDVYPHSFNSEVHQHVIRKLGKDVEIVLPWPKGENMGVITKL